MNVCVDCKQRCLMFHGTEENLASSSISSFFKIMIDDHFSEALIFPPKFARKVSSVIKHEVFLEDAEGNRWITKVSSINGSLGLQEGWTAFASEHGLQIGDFLVFYYIKESGFTVRIYDRSACEKTEFPVHRNERENTRKAEVGVNHRQDTSTSISFGSYEETSQGQCEMSNSEKHGMSKKGTSTNKKRSLDPQVDSDYRVDAAKARRYIVKGDFDVRKSEKSSLFNVKIRRCTDGSKKSNLPSETLPPGDVILVSEKATRVPKQEPPDEPIPFGPPGFKPLVTKDKGKSPAICSHLPNEPVHSGLTSSKQSVTKDKGNSPAISSHLPNEPVCSGPLSSKPMVVKDKGKSLAICSRLPNKPVPSGPLSSKPVSAKDKGKSPAIYPQLPNKNVPSGSFSSEQMNKKDKAKFPVIYPQLPKKPITSCPLSLEPTKKKDEGKSPGIHPELPNKPITSGPLSLEPTKKKDEGQSQAITPHLLTISPKKEIVEYSETKTDSCDRAIILAETSNSKPRENPNSLQNKMGWSSNISARGHGRVHESMTHRPPYVHSLPPPGATFISCSIATSPKPFLELPASLPVYACKVLRKSEKNVMFLRDPEMRLWPVLYDESGGMKRLMGGWEAFSIVNNIQAGDECCFGIENQDAGFIGVTIVRKQDN